jgi:mannose-6-phosphate isomerase-like protein (cupin superfamily)
MPPEPDTTATAERPVRVVHGAARGMEEAVLELLPPTGSVEVQRDTPLREHPTHTHPTDETLLILDGSISFTVGGESRRCGPGDRLLLPEGTPHASVAGPEGCLYVIAMEIRDDAHAA